MLIGARLEHQSIFDLFQCAALMGLKIPVWSKILKKHASNVKMGAWGLVRWEGRKSSGCPTNNIWDGISKNNNWEYTNRYQGDKQKQWAWVLSWTGGSPGRFWAMMVKAECGGRGSLNGWIFQPRVCPLCPPDEWKRVWGWWRLLMGSDSSANPCLPNVCQLGSSNCYWSLREACRGY